MSGLNLSISAGTAPNGTPLPSSAQALLNFCAQYLGISGANLFNGINFGVNTPAPENRGLPWFKTDTNGNPVGLFSWNGTAWITTPTVFSQGTTPNRPATPSNGSGFYDTTIGVLLIYDSPNASWKTADGSPGDIKEVLSTTLPDALTKNPGWAQHTASNGMVIGGAGDANSPATAHTPGQILGEEAHTIQVSELPAHAHAETWATYSGAFQNGTQPTGVFPAVSPGSLNLTPANTANAGGGAAANVIQPTMYLYRLYKRF